MCVHLLKYILDHQEEVQDLDQCLKNHTNAQDRISSLETNLNGKILKQY